VLAVLLSLCLAAPLTAQQPGIRQTATGAQLDFQDADLRLVLSALAELGGLNLIYANLPSRNVTLRTTQPVARENILPLLRSLAASNGLRVVEDGGFVRVEDASPARDARAAGRPAGDSTAQEARLYVHRLRHARAPRLASTLQSIFGGSQQGGAQGSSGAARRPLSQGLRDTQIQPTSPTPSPTPEVRVDVGAVQTPSLPAQLRGEVQIVPDEATNSLLVLAQPGDWEVVLQAIEALDRRPLQVLIEVMIAEVRRTSDLQFGVGARVGSDSGIAGRVTTGQLGNTGAFALRIMRPGGVPFDVAFSALASGGQVRVLSRPVIFAQNNQEARILIGSERPFVQVVRSLPTDAAVRDQVVQYRDVGTSLSIIPTINDDGYVNLQVSQEVSNATAETQFGAPIISTREASTHVFMRDGQTAVLGGLVDQQQDHSRSGIPFLKDLPVLGGLFGTTRTSNIQSELFLFLTPHIIATDEDADRIRDGLEHGVELLRPDMPAAPIIPRDTTRARPRPE